MNSNKILVADDEPSMRLNMVELLEDEGYKMLQASNGAEAIKLAIEHEPLVVLMDIKMPEMNGIQALKAIKKHVPKIPVIVFTAFGSNEKPIEAMKAGAFDYLEKPFDADEFLAIINSAADQSRRSRKIGDHQSKTADANLPVVEEYIVGSSKKMQEILKLIGKIAPKEATVLLQGESGTGKEVIADALYRHSNRENGPFIKINCGALPDSLLESELFGHEAGAFTGAIKQRRGRFELADKGTIFLDEVNALTPSMQIKLLRVLQQFTFERVGGEKTISTDTRVIAATNKDLTSMIQDGSFREDLYYRLNVIHLQVPPLRERTDDIEPLITFFLKKYSPHKEIVISPEALNFLKSYQWPGNVRELENVIQRAIVLMQGKVLNQSDLSIPLNSEVSSTSQPDFKNGTIPFHDVVRSVERDLILKALNHANWNKTEAARLLDINRRLLYSKMEQLNISRKTA